MTSAAPASLQGSMPSLDPGKMRGLQRITTSDGFFVVLALDHLISFKDMLADDRSKVSYQQAVDAKLELVNAVAPVASAFLLEAQFSLAQVIASRALPGSVGLIASIEGEGFDTVDGERRTRFRPHWTTRKIKMLGADMEKLLWFYRSDAKTAEAQRQVVRDLVVECAEQSLPFVVEPIWYALPGEDTKTTAWKERRVEGRGIELSQAGVNESLARGLSVIQGDADTDLVDYPDACVDYVILSDTIQAMVRPKQVLTEMLRIGRKAIVSFPNFGHWTVRASLGFKGRMPVTENLPYSWYDTPNIHFCTLRDFTGLCAEVGAKIETPVVLDSGGRRMTSAPWWFWNLFGQQAVFLLSR